jgi:hypothetical protein
MKITDNEIPEEMNWADYCDALSNERFLKVVYDRKPSQRPQHHASVTAEENSDRVKVEPLS